MADLKGQTLGRYEILEVIGKGGMATVYKARQRSTSRVVALKVLPDVFAQNERSQILFQREAEVVARLEHPHILPVYDFGQADDTPYLVMRYMEHGTAADLLARGVPELAQSIQIIAQVADALDHAHRQGVIHRDIKPSNVLLDARGNALLTDFGIAALFDEDERGESEGRVVGSAAYMSPEQCHGEPTDARSDIYALGVMLFEFVTGEKPYQAETPLGMVVQHISEPIPSARARNPDVPPAVDALIRETMAKQPEHRPATAAEFAHRLRDTRETLAAAEPATALDITYPHGLVVSTEPHAPRSTAEAVPIHETVSAPPQPRQEWLPRLVGIIALVPLLLVCAAICGWLAFQDLPGMLIAALATETPLPTATPIATVEPTTAPPTPTPTPVGQLLFDSFDDRSSGFTVRSDADGGVRYEDGSLVFESLTKGVTWFSPSGRVSALDVKVEVDVVQRSGTLNNEFGVICRWQGLENFVMFAMNGQGTFTIRQRTGSEDTVLLGWTQAEAIKVGIGALNQMRATCTGNTLSLEINGVQLASVEAPDGGALPAGDAALFGGLLEEGEMTVAFDNVRVSMP